MLNSVPLNRFVRDAEVATWAAPLQTWKESAADGQRRPLLSIDNVQQGHESSMNSKIQADAAIQTEQDTRLPR